MPAVPAPKVILGEFAHETNTFNDVPTDVAAFETRQSYAGEGIDRLRGTNSEVAGFLDVADKEGWRLVKTVAASAGPGGIVSEEAYARYAGAIVKAAREHQDCDGVILALHGAMVTEGDGDGEGRLLADLRAVLGPRVPIAVTLDLHANVTDRMAALANALISYRTYPHIDMRERGGQAAGILADAMAGRVRPRVAVARRRMVEGADHGRSEGPLMQRLLAKARAHEKEPGVLEVSINGGFGDADIVDAGPSVTVTGDGESPRWQAIAEAMMDVVWAERDTYSVRYLEPAQAVAEAKRLAGGKPVVIADYADNPGGGGYGDATNLLSAMLKGGLANAAFGSILDPEAAQIMHKAGKGATVRLALGGKRCPAMGGGPLQVEGTVMAVTDGRYVYRGPMSTGMDGSLGPTAVLRVGGVDVQVVSLNAQLRDRQMFATQGIDPTAKAFLAVKSMHHFRADFEPIAAAVLVADSGALCTPDYRKRTFRNLRRPIYPLDPAEACA